ncbi:DgyrCDS11110 [Dimorphilus gyrociliatus]|uniref:DgyrCDS11110 n=1 Tax=Dimorphilus gyrociliatus TaxID=2664684 RepID=A0A7I8W7C3_9ANNE|nr:DgyrCDS11110 [Dimorphilus gyrociliatus]
MVQMTRFCLFVACLFQMVLSSTLKKIFTEGEKATLECNSRNIFPVKGVYWFKEKTLLTKNRTVVSSDERHTIHNERDYIWDLSIADVKKEDKGDYLCRVESTESKVTSVSLDIHYKPEIKSVFNNITLRRGEDKTVSCVAEGNPKPSIFWLKDNRQHSEGKDLKLKSVTTNSSGKYTCKAMVIGKKGFQDLKSFNLAVTDKPIIHIPAERIVQKEGSDAALICFIHAVDLIRGYWTRNEFESKVPEMLSQPTDQIAKINYTARFNCTVTNLAHYNTLIWWHFSYNGWFFIASSDKALISRESYFMGDKYDIGSDFSLSIKNVQETDSGSYMCEVKNFKNFTAVLTVAGQVHCSREIVVKYGDNSEAFCQIPYSGPNPGWQAIWKSGNSSFSAIFQSDYNIYNATLAFAAIDQHKEKYVCEISSKDRKFFTTCESSIIINGQNSVAYY